MLVVDAKKLTLTQTIVVAKIDIKRFWDYRRDALQYFLDESMYPDYHEAYKKALDYELSDSDVAEILERVKGLCERALCAAQDSFIAISDIMILCEAVAEWCDHKFELGGTAL